MPIRKDGNNIIIYDQKTDLWSSDITGVFSDSDIAISDENDPLKQLKFDISPLPTDTDVTFRTNSATASDIVITLPATSGTLSYVGSGNSFSTIQTDAGTSPVATSGSDTLTLTSSDSSILITGDAGTDTVDFTVDDSAISITASQVSDFNEAAQDAVGTILTDTATIDFTYNDAGNTITADVIESGLTLNNIGGILSLSKGGTNKNMTAVEGGIVWTDADSQEVSAAGTSGQVLTSGGTGAPVWVNQSTLSGMAHSGLTGLTTGDDHTQYALLAGRAGGQTAIGGTAASNNLVLRSTSNATKGQVYLDETTDSTSVSTGTLRLDGGVGIAKRATVGSISAPGSGSNSERFGASSGTSTFTNSTAVGNTATVTGNNGTAIGYNAVASLTSVAVGSGASAPETGGNGLAVGYNAVSAGAFGFAGLAIGTNSLANNFLTVTVGGQATALNAFSLGAASMASGSSSIAIGTSNSSTGSFSIAMGANATADNAMALGGAASAAHGICIGRGSSVGHNSIALGGGATTTAANQLLLGGTSVRIDEIYIGQGVTNTTPTAKGIQPTSQSGTNKTGVDLSLRAGASTGTGVGGNLNFQITPAGTTGATLNTQTTVARINATNRTGEIRLGHSASSFAALGGTSNVNTTQVGNIGTGEDDLITYSLPANSLPRDGAYIEFETAGTFAANANNKQVKIYFGATVIFATGAQAFNAGAWTAKCTVIRTGATTQKASVQFASSNSLLTSSAAYTTPAETLSSAVTIKCTGEATANDDIVQQLFTCKFFANV